MEKSPIVLPNAWYIFIENYITLVDATEQFTFLKKKVNWQNSTFKLFGKEINTPRMEAFYGENEVTYSYSNKILQRNDFFLELLSLKNKLETDFELKFNAVLFNLYRNGLDSNGWHADNEKELGKNPIIASISLGATRRFDLKHQISGEKLSLKLNSGSLLIMGGEMQHFWKHQVPKEKKILEERINLTFRSIKI